MKVLITFLLLGFPLVVSAQELDEQGMFKENYLFPLSYESQHPNDRRAQEIKFRFSLYQRLFETQGHQAYFAFTQTSWWQAYDQDQSRPFRETNYNPEVFIQLPKFDLWGQPQLQLGAEHESNGGREPYSRSWNRLYGRYQLQASGVQMQHKFFWRVPEQPKQYPLDPTGDENPDIVDYYGANEIQLRTKFGPAEVSGRFRRNLSKGRGSVELMGAYPFGFNSASAVFQYFQGYGESLADYNRSVSKASIGILLNHL